MTRNPGPGSVDQYPSTPSTWQPRSAYSMMPDWVRSVVDAAAVMRSRARFMSS
jgi:hypothetical protein